MDELSLAQESLGKSIDRARAGEDPALAGIVREKGEQAVNLLYGLLRMSRLHAADNDALKQPVAELAGAFARLTELLGALNLVAVEDQVYINEIRIRTMNQRDGRTLGAELAAHNVGGLTFSSAPAEPHVRALLRCLNARPATERPRLALKNALVAAGVDMVDPTLLHRFRLAGEEVVQAVDRRDARALVGRGVELVEAVWENLAAGRRLNVLPLRRVVTDLIEVGPGHEELWWDPPGATRHGLHSFRVAQYALLAGQGVGLSMGLRQDLGVAALVHDIGAVRAPGEGHTRAGSLALLQQVGFHEGKVRRVLAALDHHRQHVETVGGRSTLFGRIIHMAEDFDLLVRSGATPAQAIGSISGGAGSRYDPVMFQGLVNRLGRFPPGTHLRLEDRRIVRTISVVRSPETFDKPRAIVVRGADGRPPPSPVVIDLAEGGRVAALLGPPPA